MKNLASLLLLSLCCFSTRNSIAQEVLIPAELIWANDFSIEFANKKLSLPPGQWTPIDRLSQTPRFQQAMEAIALNNRTDQLANLDQISGYYSYLDRHPKVIAAGVRWQGAAAVTTGMLPWLQVAAGLTYIGAGISSIFTDGQDQTNALKTLANGISESGYRFMDGTASKAIVKDITSRFYSPLLKNVAKVPDPFTFDADVLYREQYIILQPNYYNKFSTYDKELILGLIAEIYANGFHDMGNTFRPTDLSQPRVRLILGLKKMGYSEERINQYLANKKI